MSSYQLDQGRDVDVVAVSTEFRAIPNHLLPSIHGRLFNDDTNQPSKNYLRHCLVGPIRATSWSSLNNCISNRKKEQTKALVIQAIQQGFRGIDTACQPKHYREDLVGEALAELYEKNQVTREDIFVQTKYTPIGGHDRSQPIPYDPSVPIPVQIRTSLQKSLSNLRTAWLDSYLLHSPLETTSHTKEAWNTLCDLRKEGLVRRIGVSNTYDVQALELLQSIGEVDVVQNRWYEGNAWDAQVVLDTDRKPVVIPAPLDYQHCTQPKCHQRSGSTNAQHMKDGLESDEISLHEHLDSLKGLVGH
ncbi:aldo/keto reductase family domain-containing protein [Rhizoctonia solani AG-1 IA]|uniref:Aldo/keto reductase family domain-containing protein n=1 Tax=Thanatephorus cucumeris (strain AG1-IA) TaxID=983506 RepID=L8WKN4_THACA|nr:aldo/keto reductase family domain-containing protein [Rhizoctonia solani AG-1 IA]